MRGFKFWASELLEMTGIGALILVILTFVMSEGLGIEGNFFANLSNNLWFIGAFILFFAAYGMQLIHLPLLISFSATRKECYVGYLLYRIAATVIFTGLGIVAAFLSGSVNWTLALAAAVFTQTLQHFGSLTGLATRFNKILGTLILVVPSGFMGGMIGFSGSSGENILARLRFFPAVDMLTVLLCAGTVMIALDLAISYASIKKLSVKL